MNPPSSSIKKLDDHCFSYMERFSLRYNYVTVYADVIKGDIWHISHIV